MFTAVIVDDEARNIALLSYYLEKYCPNIKLAASFTKKKTAVEYLISNKTTNKPDILFLDIVLDEGSGFDILDEINYDEIQVVMCTAHDEFALRAIRYQVVDYLLKPLEIQDLISTADKIEKKLTSTDGKQVFNAEMVSQFHSSNGKVPKRFTTWTDRASIDIVSVDDIVCVETHKGKEKTEVVLKEHGKNEYLLVNMSLLEMEKKLAPTNTFFRVSRTALVSINEIKSILRNVKYTIILSNGKKLYISRKGYRELIEFIEKAYETKD